MPRRTHRHTGRGTQGTPHLDAYFGYNKLKPVTTVTKEQHDNLR